MTMMRELIIDHHEQHELCEHLDPETEDGYRENPSKEPHLAALLTCGTRDRPQNRGMKSKSVPRVGSVMGEIHTGTLDTDTRLPSRFVLILIYAVTGPLSESPTIYRLGVGSTRSDRRGCDPFRRLTI